MAVGFQCDVIRCELARRGVRHGATHAAANSSASGRGGNAVGLTSILGRRQLL